MKLNLQEQKMPTRSPPTHLPRTLCVINDSLKDDRIINKFLRRIIMPSDISPSGIGSILYFKNITGRTLIGTGFLISLFLLIFGKFIKRREISKYLLLTNILCLVILIVDSLIAKVSLLFGAWTIFALLIFQIILDANDRKKASR